MGLLNSKLPKAMSIACAQPSLTGLWAEMLDPFMWQWGIKSPRRVAAFIGQLAVESAGFTTLQEDLSYSAGRMMQVWPSHFPTDPDLLAQRCAHNPEALANVVYCDRMGNGNEASGDGYTFRGAGLIQLTGRENQSKFADYCKIEPEKIGDYLRQPKGAAESACWVWVKLYDLNPLAEGWFITSISRKINGGLNGLQARIDMSNKILKGIGG